MKTPSYAVVHERIRRAWGLASDHPCVNCGRPADEWSYDGQDPQELHGHNGNEAALAYSLNWVQHYDPRCVSCHRAADTQYCPRGHDKDVVGRYPGGSCRVCRREQSRDRMRAYREADPEKINAYKRARYAANPNRDAVLAKGRARYAANRDKELAYREANRDRINANQRARREATRDKDNARRRERRAAAKAARLASE